MNTKLLILFIALNIVNVIIQTVKSLATVCDLPLWLKVVVVGACNLVGVFCVKWGEEKARKDKLWEVRATVYETYTESLHHDLESANIPHNYIPNIGKYTIFNIYCETQTESKRDKNLLDYYKVKYFVSESKTL